jgi:hypothetical protein
MREDNHCHDHPRQIPESITPPIQSAGGLGSLVNQTENQKADGVYDSLFAQVNFCRHIRLLKICVHSDSL